MTHTDHPAHAEDETPATNTSRRALLGRASAAAVVATAAAAVSTKPVSAANGDPLTLGAPNVATNTTRVFGGTTLRVEDGSSLDQASISATAGGTSATGLYAMRGASTGVGATGGAGVFGTATGDNATGVVGLNTSADGAAIRAIHSIQGNGSGIGLAASSTNGTGVVASGPEADLRLEGSSIVQFFGDGVGGTGPGTAGELAGNGAGELWFCYETGVGKWVRLAAPSSAGSFNPVSPYRAYDSRRPAPTPGSLGPNSSRVVSLAASRDGTTGAVLAADAIPAGATAVTFNLTVVNTVGRGFLAVAEGDASSTSASSINWSSSGTVLANAATIKLDGNRQVKVFNGSGGTTDFIIDVTGYYR